MTAYINPPKIGPVERTKEGRVYSSDLGLSRKRAFSTHSIPKKKTKNMGIGNKARAHLSGFPCIPYFVFQFTDVISQSRPCRKTPIEVPFITERITGPDRQNASVPILEPNGSLKTLIIDVKSLPTGQ